MSYLVIDNIKIYQLPLHCSKSLIACISNGFSLIPIYSFIQIYAYKLCIHSFLSYIFQT